MIPSLLDYCLPQCMAVFIESHTLHVSDLGLCEKNVRMCIILVLLREREREREREW